MKYYAPGEVLAIAVSVVFGLIFFIILICNWHTFCYNFCDGWSNLMKIIKEVLIIIIK